MTDHDVPPDGGNAGKPMRAAISAALRREAEGDDGQTAPAAIEDEGPRRVIVRWKD